MKVLLMSPLPPPSGGIATWTELYLRSKKAMEHCIKLVDTAVKGSRVNKLNKKSLIDEIKRSITIYLQMNKSLKEEEYDVAHMNIACSTYGMLREYLCAKRMKKKIKKLFLHCHCDTSVKVKGRIAELLFKKLCVLSDIILCLNQTSKNHIKSIAGKEAIVFPNFFDTDELGEFPDSITSSAIKTIVYAGHIIKAKGCDKILEVAEKFPEKNFKLIGYISDDIKSLTYPKNVSFLGTISKKEVIQEMQSADVLLFPSQTEGFPNVVLEAMACGLPIIATPVGAIPEMIERWGGILVPVGDVEAMVKAVSELENPEKRHHISKWNKQKVFSHYSVTSVMNQLFDLYRVSGYGNEMREKHEGCINY